MKYLSEYIDKGITKLLKENGAFFAFSTEQLKEQNVVGVKYVNLESGLICPKKNVKALVKGMDKNVKNGIAQDIKENGKNRIIKRELNNHEFGYTGEIEQTVDSLTDYDITEKEIAKVAFKS